MAEKAEADVMVYGHTHKPYRKDIGEKVFINAGSVGKPKDGDPRACVALVAVMTEGVAHKFLILSYAVEKVASTILASGLPSGLAVKLRDAN